MISICIFSKLFSQEGQDTIIKKQLDSYFNQSYEYQKTQDYNSSLNILLKADSIISMQKSFEVERIQCSLKIGKSYYSLNNIEKAAEYILLTAKEASVKLTETHDSIYLKYFIDCQYYFNQLLLQAYIVDETKSVYNAIKSDSILYNKCDLVNAYIINFIFFYWGLGDFESAKIIIDEHINYCDRYFPKSSELHAYYNMLKAVCLKHLDQINNSEASFRKSKELYEGQPNNISSAYYPTVLINLANIYADINLLTKYKNCNLNILQTKLNNSLINYYAIFELQMAIGYGYLKFNMFDSTLFYYNKAIEIRSANIHEVIYMYDILVLTSFAELYYKMGDYSKVHEALNRVLKIFDSQSLQMSIDRVTANLLNANTFLNDTKYSLAIKEFYSNQITCDSAYGRKKYYFENIFGGAKVQYFMQDYGVACDNFYQYFEYYKKKINDASFFLSEVELQGYIEKFESVNDYLVSLAEIVHEDSIVSGAYDAWLFKQGFVINTIRKIKSIKDTDPVIQSKYEELVQAQSELTMELSKPTKFQRKLDSVMNIKNLREKELAALSKNVEKELKQINHSDILKSLRNSEILLEFVTYKFKETPLIDQNRYGVFVLEPGTKKVNFISLCSASLLDSIAGQALDFLSVNALYDNPELVNLVWNKILPYLKDKKRIYITTSGMLNKVNISALRLNVNQTVSDLFEITYLNSSKDLLSMDRSQNTKTSFATATLYGDIDYSLSASASEGTYVTGTLRGLNYFDFFMTDPGARRSKWQKLKYSKAEIDNISLRLKHYGCEVKLLDRINANENYIKSHYGPLNKNYSPELFHFSTHAYFLPQKKSKSNTDGIYTTYRRMGDFSLIQSGIVLSGANKNWNVTDSSYYDDGILTAFEISQLNLQNTKLVVLSACDTGLGEISNSEGVYGLRRAFKIAGVDKILMSLWSVADYQTMEFMKIFYENLCTKKLSPRLALSATQKTMRQKKYEPYYWAGFVLIE
jgi:CHAT domain-containing protein